jgi:hypothetical protein
MMKIMSSYLVSLILILCTTVISDTQCVSGNGYNTYSITLDGVPVVKHKKPSLDSQTVKILKSIVRCTAGLLLIGGGSGNLAHSVNLLLSNTNDPRDVFLALGLMVTGTYFVKKGWDWINKNFKWRDVAKLMAVSMISGAVIVLPHLPLCKTTCYRI